MQNLAIKYDLSCIDQSKNGIFSSLCPCGCYGNAFIFKPSQTLRRLLHFNISLFQLLWVLL